MMRAPEPEQIAVVVNRLSTLYEAAGLRLGCALVEANALLVLADLRGTTNLLLYEPTEANRRHIAALQPTLNSLGLRWRIEETATPLPSGRLCSVIILESLAGYAYISRQTEMRGMTPFDGIGGWEGWEAWGRPCFDALRENYEPEPVLLDRWIGLALGYPDRAIEDACQAITNGGFPATFVHAPLPSVKCYGGASPNFSYAPEHADDPGIVFTIQTWEALLEGVYASAWHQQLVGDPAFQAARRERRGIPHEA